MPRILISSKVIAEQLRSQIRVDTSEYSEVNVVGNQLIIWDNYFLIVKGKGDQSDFSGTIANKSIVKLVLLCQQLENQPIVVVLSEDRSIITVDNIDL